MKQIFAIIYDKNKKEDIIALCNEFSSEYREINSSEIGSTIGSLMGLPIPPAGDNPTIPAVYAPPELLLFSDFSGEDLEKFLDKYKENNIPPTKLKGTVTPYNLNWTVYKLIKDYEEESM